MEWDRNWIGWGEVRLSGMEWDWIGLDWIGWGEVR